MPFTISMTLVVLGALLAAHRVAASLGQARISCDAAYNAPCSRVNSEWLATKTAKQMEKEVSSGKDLSEILRQVIDKDYNMNTGFYPFIFERNSSRCVAHGQDPSLVGSTMEVIFVKQNFGFSNATDLHQRFVQAAENGGDWVQYFWKEGYRVVDRMAYVTGVTDQWYVGVGYTNEQLPLDLPCSSEFDSWCSINNVRSIMGKAENHLNEAVTLEKFETALHDISYDSSRFEAPGGYYTFVAKYSGELMAHPRLQSFLGQHYADIFPQIGRERADGQALLYDMVAAAQGENDGWLQFEWQNQTKVAYFVKVAFRGEDYLLGSGFTFEMGQVIPAPLGQKCPGYNLPCAFGTTLQLTSHALTHAISSPLSVNEVFDAITYDAGLKHDDYYVFLYDFNDTSVAFGAAPQLVGLHGAVILEKVVGMTRAESEVLLGAVRSTAEQGGGYVFYKWRILDVPDSEFLKVAYVFRLTLEGRDYYGGVGFNHQRAPLQLELEYGSKLNGEQIPCSSAFGTNCSEVNSQAILGQALSDLILAASESKAGLNISSASVEDVLVSITDGDDLYRANDFSVAVFSFDQTKCVAEGALADNSGCCVAHGGNPAFVGLTWQDILAAQEITSIRGEDLHEQLSGESDIGGGWFEYSLARQGDVGKPMRALSSRFRNQGEDFYVVTEYVAQDPPPTCDLCPDTMECMYSDQSFCLEKKSKSPWHQSTIFIVLCAFVLGLPPVGAILLWVGKRREKKQAEAQIRKIDQQMQILSNEMEREKMTAAQSRKLVSSLFPENVQSQILDQIEEEEHRSTSDKPLNFLSGSKRNLEVSNKPIAELFPAATLIFMDIVGFTAWSSTREPSQVFRLLEGVYQEFDRLAKERRVFKVSSQAPPSLCLTKPNPSQVETIGDCWLGAAGLPERMDDHAVVMALFASDCTAAFKKTVQGLEMVLGPDTGDLSIRAGIHSGPVTAGVLKGDKARFQLFGDTVNTCSRLETTGAPGMIHVSQETADLLRAAGKSRWYTPRKDTIVAKGKGKISTFWLDLGTSAKLSFNNATDAKKYEQERLSPVGDGGFRANYQADPSPARSFENTNQPTASSITLSKGRGTVLDEVCDVVDMPSFCGQQSIDPDEIILDPKVADQPEAYA